MKKLLSIIFLAPVLFLSSCNSFSGSEVVGHLDQVSNQTLLAVVSDLSILNTDWTDTIYLKNGDFHYKLDEPTPRSVLFIGLPKEGHELFENGNPYISLVMVPGEKAEINGTLSDYTLSGTSYYTEQEAFVKRLDSLTKDVPDYEQLQVVYDQTMAEYVKAHPNSTFAGYLAATMSKNSDEAWASLDSKVKEGPMKYYRETMVKMQQAAAEREKAAEKIVAGAEAPDFTLNTAKGDAQSLSALRGKYVLLDFWGSWCHWCIQGFPDMKASYAKHSDKVEFLGISCNDSEDAWLKALDEQQLPWINTLNGDPSVSELYGISGYPTKILIDPQGIIVKVVVGEDPELYTFLDELFK